MPVSPGKGSAFQYRQSTGALAANISGTAVTAPLWVKLVRAGTSFTAYQSSDGTSWALIGTATVNMGSTVQLGLAVSSHTTTQAETATFDFVSR